MNPYPLALINLSDPQAIDTLVEHRRVYSLENCELNIFETFHSCKNVILSYNGLVVSSMMRGKKIMSINDEEAFDFLPGETLILPDGITMKVQFPEAHTTKPVQCATLTLNWDTVQHNLNFLNEQYPNTAAPFEWKLHFEKYHFANNKELTQCLNRLIQISMEDNPAKDALADLSLKFLLLRLVQTQNLASIQDRPITHPPFQEAVQYIHQHFREKIGIDLLARKACMSQSAFFKMFKAQFGITPLEYILKQRMELAKSRLVDQSISITEICYESGFNNLNHFTKLFKRQEGLTPTQYRGK